MKKIVVTIEGKTVILQYQVKPGSARKGSGWETYIEVLPTPELSRFNLKGLSPETFCVNISDMVNIGGVFSAVVENEQQIPVARWEMNPDDYHKAIGNLKVKLTHLQMVNLLNPLPGFVQETDSQFIDFEERVLPLAHEAQPAAATHGGYRLTIVTDDMGDKIAPYAFYNLDVHTGEGWQGYPPPQAYYEAVRTALKNKLHAIGEAGVPVTQIYDETDYAAGMPSPL